MSQIIRSRPRCGVVALVLAGSLAAVSVASAAAGPVPRVVPCPQSVGKMAVPDRIGASCERRQAAHRAAGPTAATVVRTGSAEGGSGDTAPVIAAGALVLVLVIGGGTLMATHSRRGPQPQP
jgi:hypothetical protein